MKTNENATGARQNRRLIVWCVVALVLLAAGLFGARLVRRARNVVGQAKFLRALARTEFATPAPMLGDLSDEFWQMAFGADPALLARVKELLAQALLRDPKLAQLRVALLVVTDRGHGDGRDFALHIFGTAGAAPELGAAGPLASQVREASRSLMVMLGHDVVILAAPETEKRQRQVLDGIRNNYPAIVKEYLKEPVTFALAVPDPGRYFAPQLRGSMVCLTARGVISLDKLDAETRMISNDKRRAKDLAQLLTDTRLMAVGVAHLRYASPAVDVALKSISDAEIRAEGKAAIVQGTLPGDVIQDELPRMVQLLSRGIGRVQPPADNSH